MMRHLVLVTATVGVTLLASFAFVIRAADESGGTACKPSPLDHDTLMEPHQQGCERIRIQDLEFSLKMTRKEVARIRQQREANLNDWTRRRRERAQEVGASWVVSKMDHVVRDRDAAIALGKMFFWDERAGSDGQTACATCHFAAGADARTVDGERRQTSIGVAVNRLTTGEPADRSNGLEPSRELKESDLLMVYEHQWGGMVNFPSVLRRLAGRALERAAIEVQGFSLTDKQKQDILKTAAYLDAYPGVAEQLKMFRDAVAVGFDPQVPRGFYKVAETSISLASELLTYAEEREKAPTERVEDVFRSAGEKLNRPSELDEGKGKRAAQMPSLMRLLAPREFKHWDESPRPSRQSLGRNSPTVINAALFDRLFHDGRAASVFNGYDLLGDDAGPDGYGKWICTNGRLHRVLVRLPHSALASQATAPLLSAAEMSWFGRQFHHVAQKLLDEHPLSLQEVHPNDSVLEAYLAKSPGKDGHRQIRQTYRQLIQRAFHEHWWCASNRFEVQERDAVSGQPLALTQMEMNFSLFWGVAIQLYEETLISDQSPFDKLMSLRRQGLSLPDDESTKRILKGFSLFQDHACADCHIQPEFAGGTFATLFGPLLEFEGPLDFANAATEGNEFIEWLETRAAGAVPDGRIEAMPFRTNLSPRIYDAGYYNIGVSSDMPGVSDFDPGNGGQVRVELGSNNEALSSVRARFGNGLPVPLLERNPPLSFSLARNRNDRLAVAIGAFKTATLRNVALTGPYFHNGSGEDLCDVLQHYERPLHSDNEFLHPALLGEGRNGDLETDIHEDARPLVIEFLKSLTDPRVENNLAPFDHPSLRVPIDEAVDENGRSVDGSLRRIEATGGK